MRWGSILALSMARAGSASPIGGSRGGQPSGLRWVDLDGNPVTPTEALIRTESG